MLRRQCNIIGKQWPISQADSWTPVKPPKFSVLWPSHAASILFLASAWPKGTASGFNDVPSRQFQAVITKAAGNYYFILLATSPNKRYYETALDNVSCPMSVFTQVHAHKDFFPLFSLLRWDIHQQGKQECNKDIHTLWASLTGDQKACHLQTSTLPKHITMRMPRSKHCSVKSVTRECNTAGYETCTKVATSLNIVTRTADIMILWNHAWLKWWNWLGAKRTVQIDHRENVKTVTLQKARQRGKEWQNVHLHAQSTWYKAKATRTDRSPWEKRALQTGYRQARKKEHRFILPSLCKSPANRQVMPTMSPIHKSLVCLHFICYISMKAIFSECSIHLAFCGIP